MRRNYGKYTLGVGALLTLALMGSNEGVSESVYSQKNLSTQSGRNVYIGLSYSPSWHNIQNFSVGASDGSTVAWYPGLHGAKKSWDISDFDLSIPVHSINFQNSSPLGVEGSLGYRIGAARVELEVGYEKFEVKSATGSTSDRDASSAYLLAKNLVHSLLNKQVQNFASELAKVDAQGIVDFAQAIKLTSPEIDKKVCFKQVGRSIAGYRRHVTPYSLAKHEPWSCVDFASTVFSGRLGIPGYPEYGVGSLSKRFGSLEGHNIMQEDSADGTKTNRGWPGTSKGKINTAQGMAEDLINRLNKNERETVARILTQKIAGAEVVKIRALTSASVMFNTCYDWRYEELHIVPFACAGIGANFVSVADEHYTPKLAWKVKAGLSYKLAPNLTIFASGFHHRVLSEGKYEELPVYRLAGDITRSKSKQSAKASFKLAYTGAELGVRLEF
ncbi:hypothetical protein ANPL_02535 [Anaplasma platys]|uniref:Msp4/OMP-like domain-containing protein n=1 Tax=Anaplasma platys TaxID=949 RepID=A0A858PY78_9RICK|nr:P44/Msp2 family outer membrane protein [Anaplasma platys]QJC27566.1 hypothetical protein ANPL_02535 [Anaplasma platys]